MNAMIGALLGGSLFTVVSMRDGIRSMQDPITSTARTASAYSCPKELFETCSNRATISGRRGDYGCTNRVVVNHKHGWMMVVKDIVDQHFPNQTDATGIKELWNADTPWFEDTQIRETYREAIITRNFVDAILSGYQFHQSGKECNKKYREEHPTELTLPAHPGWIYNLTQPATQRMVATTKYNKMSLCNYLQFEPNVNKTMRVYMDYAIHTWYDEHFRYAERVKDLNTSLFVCYGDLYSARTRRDTLEKMKRWFTHDYDNQHPPPLQDSRTFASSCGRIPKSQYYFEDLQLDTEEYRGNHATDHSNMERRAMLKNLIRDMDQKHFGGKLQKANHFFGCPELN